MKLELEDFLSILPGAKQYDNGRYIAGICPWHEDSKPSLLVFADGWFQCQACNRRGRFKLLYDKLQGWGGPKNTAPEVADFSTPHFEMDEVPKIARSASRILDKHPEMGWYYEERGVEDRIQPCMLGWYNGWHTIPVIGEDGDINGLVMRAGPHIEKATGRRFSQPHGMHPMLYVPDWHLFRKREAVAVVYGMFDALALSSLGFAVCTTTGGKDSFKPEWLDDTRKPIHVIPDKEPAEEIDTAYELVSKLGWRGHVIKLDYPEDCKDPADYVKESIGKRKLLQRTLGKWLA